MKARWLKVLALLLLIPPAVLAVDYLRFLRQPIELGAQSLRYEIPAGATLRAVAGDLHAQGLLSRPLYWRILARVENKAGKLKVGEYELEDGLTPGELLDRFVAGKTVQYSLTIPEGWSFRQMMEVIATHPQIKTTLSQEDYPNIMAKLGDAGMHPEGWFYPDTYFFPRNTSDREFLRRAYDIMKQRLEEEWAERDEGLPFKTPYEALIMASIVEKETGVADERPMIAAVFISRLKKGMRLQTDPTVIYGMGERYKGNIRKSDLKYDTPYNTYTRAGLPPTPIAMPSGDAIHAVMHPADTKALYFVASGGGRHYFSETYEEHRQAVIKYLLGGNPARYKGDR